MLFLFTFVRLDFPYCVFHKDSSKWKCIIKNINLSGNSCCYDVEESWEAGGEQDSEKLGAVGGTPKDGGKEA